MVESSKIPIFILPNISHFSFLQKFYLYHLARVNVRLSHRILEPGAGQGAAFKENSCSISIISTIYNLLSTDPGRCPLTGPRRGCSCRAVCPQHLGCPAPAGSPQHSPCQVRSELSAQNFHFTTILHGLYCLDNTVSLLWRSLNATYT